MRDIDEIGAELTNEEVDLVAGGCGGNGTCTSKEAMFCDHYGDGTAYCWFAHVGDED